MINHKFLKNNFSLRNKSININILNYVIELTLIIKKQ